ncbi:MAG: hypothetical protein PVH19_12035, partial [Planctomycetia bacterium]
MQYRYQKIFPSGVALLGILLILTTGGCQSSLWSLKNTKGKEDQIIPTGKEAEQLQSAPQPTTGANVDQPAVPAPAATPQQVMAEVRRLGAVNPTAQAALMQELEKADPNIWPGVLQNFRSRLAMGDRLHNEEVLAARVNSQNGANPGQNPQYVNQNPYYANQPIPANTYPNQNPTQTPTVNQPYPQQQPYPAYPQPAAPQNYAPQGYQNYPAQQPYPNAGPQNYQTPSPQAMPGYPHTSAKPADPGVIQASYEAPLDEPALEKKPLDSTTSQTKTPALEDQDWRTLLAASIDSLQNELAEKNANSSQETGTLGKLDQIRLRLMLLADGRGTEAVEPIAGESKEITDFWANQMFGMSTLLDERKASDPALRNASAKHKLADSLHHLSQASSLEVRGLAFCKAVNGFANIEQFEKYTFKPGQQVILYAELDNLKYEETADGY